MGYNKVNFTFTYLIMSVSYFESNLIKGFIILSSSFLRNISLEKSSSKWILQVNEHHKKGHTKCSPQ